MIPYSIYRIKESEHHRKTALPILESGTLVTRMITRVCKAEMVAADREAARKEAILRPNGFIMLGRT